MLVKNIGGPMAQPKKSKETKHRQIAITLHPSFIAMKDALLKEGMSISEIVRQAIENEYKQLIVDNNSEE